MTGTTSPPGTTGISTSAGAPVGPAQLAQANQPTASNSVVHHPIAPARPLPGENVDRAARSAEEQAALDAEWERARETLAPGMDNDDFDALRRMFDKQVQNVRKCSPPFDSHISTGLDLHPAPDEEFTVDKLRSNLERFYASIIVGLLRFVKEVQRIRRWEDGGERSALALLVYCSAWYHGLLLATFLTFSLVLMLFPRSRRLCFDSPRLDSPGTETRLAGEQKPAATETKASEWAAMVEGGIISMMAPKGKASGLGDLGQQVADQVNHTLVKNMQDKEAAGEKESGAAEGTSQKDKAMELYGQPTMKIIGGLADKWERMANFLAPTPPFRPTRRSRILWVAVPLMVSTSWMSDRLFVRGCGFVFGLVLFGKPFMDWVGAKLDRFVPHWREKVILENNILSDIPTNSQLILRILRDAEHNRHPLPPVSTKPDESVSEDSDGDSGESSMKSKVGGRTKKITANVKNGTRAKLRRAWDRLGRVKEEGFAQVTGHSQADYRGKAENTLARLHISSESKPARDLLQRLPRGDDVDLTDRQDRFYVYHKKHGPGHIIFHPPGGSTPARVSFTTLRGVGSSTDGGSGPDQDPGGKRLTVSVNDIVGIKNQGKNWPGRLLSSWALDVDGGGGTGLEVKIIKRTPMAEHIGVEQGLKEKVETITLTGIVRRDELFDRLLAAGDQRWEMV